MFVLSSLESVCDASLDRYHDLGIISTETHTPGSLRGRGGSFILKFETIENSRRSKTHIGVKHATLCMFCGEGKKKRAFHKQDLQPWRRNGGRIVVSRFS